MIEMENKNKKINKNESITLEFLKVVFLPEMYLYEFIRAKGGSIKKALLLSFVAFFIISIGWGLFYSSDDIENESTKSSEIFTLNNEILNIQNQLKEKDLKIKKLTDENKKLKINKESIKENSEDTKKETTLKTYTFSSGNYISGKDFEPGIYDIVAISGDSGNVISSNMFSGGINAIMGLNSSFAEKEYKNIELPKDTKLEIKNGIKIKLKEIKND